MPSKQPMTSQQFKTTLLFFAAVLATGLFPRPGRCETVDLNQAIVLAPEEYRHQLVQQLSLAEDNRQQWLDTLAKCPPEQREALAFLLVNMPEHDLKSLKGDFVLRDVALAFAARAKTSWAASVPKEIFFNDVLPYANLNERRDDWRGDFAARFAPLVQGCKSAGDAAQLLNRQVFKIVQVAYHATKRQKPDQSPYESMKSHYASCTGLSIILVDACRSVGIAARVAGTPLWSNGSGNHTWVEVWDGQWRFVGAAEPGEFNKTWFAGSAAKADDSQVEHRIYAASFQRTDVPFILVWDPSCTDYSAVDVTGYYVHRQHLQVSVPESVGPAPEATIQVRRGDRLIGQAIGRHADFELAADADYKVQALLPGGRMIREDVRLPRDSDADLHLRAPTDATKSKTGK